MLARIIAASIHNKLFVVLLVAALVAWGGYSAVHLPLDAIPDITNNQVQVITQSPAPAAQEVEQLLTVPLELQLRTVPDEAVIQGEGHSYIFAHQPGGTGAAYRFRRYKVKAGPVQNGDRAIEPLDELPTATQFVRQGAYFLEAELSKGQQAD